MSQRAKVTFKISQGHWQWCHSIGHIRFPISVPLQLCLYLASLTILSLVSQSLRGGHVTHHASLSGVVYDACTSTPMYQSAHEI